MLTKPISTHGWKGRRGWYANTGKTFWEYTIPASNGVSQLRLPCAFIHWNCIEKKELIAWLKEQCDRYVWISNGFVQTRDSDGYLDVKYLF